MIIRQASLDAFKQVAIVSFEDEMIDRCKRLSPTICQSLNREDLRRAIRRTMQDAQALGFMRRGSVQFHIDCSLAFGIGFATDPQYPWITEVLARDDFEQELHKSEALYEKVRHHLDEVAGSESRYVRGCLRRLLRMLAGDLLVRAETFEYDLVQVFETLHPEKTAYAGPVAIEALVRYAVNRARHQYGLTGTRSITLFAILMWLLGYRCDEDPFHRWIPDALTLDESKGIEAASARLEKRAVAFFEAYLQEIS